MAHLARPTFALAKQRWPERFITLRRSLMGGLLAAVCVVIIGCGSSKDGVEEETTGGATTLAQLEDQRVTDSPALREALEGADLNQRVRAARAMGRIQHASYAEDLATAAAASEPRELREAALFAFGQLGLASGVEVTRPPRKQVTDALLVEQEPALQALALEALGKVTPAAEAAPMATVLSRWLEESEDASVRAAAAHALFRLRFAPVWRREVEVPAVLPGPAIAALERALADDEAVVREMASHYFSRYPQPEAWGSLVTAATAAPDEWTRLWALRGVGRIGTLPSSIPNEESEVAREALAQRVVAADTGRERAEAVTALANMGWPEAVPAAAAEDASFHVRASAARAFGTRADAPSRARLEELFASDDSPTVRAAALQALALRLGSGARETLFATLDDEPWTLRVAAVSAAPQLGSVTDALEVLVRGWEDDDSRVRSAVVAALGQLDEAALAAAPESSREMAGTLVIAALAESDLAVRGTAVDVLGQRLAAGPALGAADAWVEPLRGAYADSGGVEWIEVREQIAGTLARGPQEQVAPELRSMAAEDPAPSVRSSARAALATLGETAPAEPPPPPAESSPWLPSRLGDTSSGETTVVLETEKGTMVLETFPQEAPVHVASFLERVDKGFYDGLLWHRVVPSFVVQGGDPRGDGWGGPGYVVRDEISRRPFRRGAVGMPKAGKDTGGCQIFITHLPTPHLDGNYTLFAAVVDGEQVIDRLEVGDRIVRAFRFEGEPHQP